jgi:hypothetical protein
VKPSFVIHVKFNTGTPMAKKSKKPVFKKKTKRLKPTDVVFSDTEIADVMPVEERRVQELEILMADWALTQPYDVGPFTFMTKVKRFSVSYANSMLALAPKPIWVEKRREFQDAYMGRIVKSQVDLVTEINDQHMKAAKLSLAKALEMLTKMKIEHYTDKTGKVKFRKFTSVDLMRCTQTINIAQKIMRTALGLPSDEGAIHIWNQMNVSPVDGTTTDDHEVEIRKAENIFSYDDIKGLIALQEAKERGEVIDIETARDAKRIPEKAASSPDKAVST